MNLVTCKDDDIERAEARPGEVMRYELPWSEVCMHLGVAGRVMDVLITRERQRGMEAKGWAFPMAQIIQEDGDPLSFPITLSEAGIRYDLEKKVYYAYVDRKEL